MFSPQALKDAAVALAVKLSVDNASERLTEGGLSLFLAMVVELPGYDDLVKDEQELKVVLGQPHADKYYAMQDVLEGDSSAAIIRGLTRSTHVQKLTWNEGGLTQDADLALLDRALPKEGLDEKRFWFTQLAKEQAENQAQVLTELRATLPGVTFYSSIRSSGEVEIYCDSDEIAHIAKGHGFS